ncbi:Uu.00g043900.m01.CDS01 [Anthostomella pinea]|uniref:Uu.00g043900.m01.CDS01 n=1 Tax=Anthostomella pinea TaxID=933095 RepID=A0AAI8VBJ5_9PEZI|nr:Uu.00g043900.m01.CDS01 [Anthostomella pinea]
MNSSPQRPTLKCDDECLRLQRNARLANALSIDPQSHTDDHVPYSDTTLKFFRLNPKWAQTYERELRVFAGDHDEKRLRFKPMKSHQRAFIHSLAEDFGFDSESSDPEPHRHVCLFKTPRFVSAPMKTLAQCAKIRASQDSLAQALSAASGDLLPAQPYNALLLSSPRFGLTVEEIDTALRKEFAAHPTVKFQTSFLPSEEVVIKGSGSWAAPQALEGSISALKPTLSQTVRRLDLAKDVCMCHVDDSLNVLRREEAARGQGEGGWSAVAGRSAARPKPAAPAAAPLRSRFIALRKEPKKKVDDEPVEEDWEAAAEKLGDE